MPAYHKVLAGARKGPDAPGGTRAETCYDGDNFSRGHARSNLMRANDQLQRFLFEHTGVRGELAHLDASWQAVLRDGDYPAPLRELLGQSLAAVVLLSATIKFQGSLTLQIQGNGPVTLLVVQADAQRHVRGLAKWHGAVAQTALPDMFGAGRLAITVEPERGGERYQSIVELQRGGLAATLDNYFACSEQLNTRLWLAADGNSCAGLLLQELPGKVTDARHEDWNRIVHLGSTISDAELLSLPGREVLRRLYHEELVRLFEAEAISFRCTCSRARIEATLRSLGYPEIKDLIEQEETLQVDCEFCRQRHEFDAVDIERIFAAPHPPHTPPTQH